MHCSRKIMNRIRIITVKAISIFMGIVLVLCMCAADTGSPLVIIPGILISGGWLFLLAYANGWVMDTDPWHQRLEREKNDLL